MCNIWPFTALHYEHLQLPGFDGHWHLECSLASGRAGAVPGGYIRKHLVNVVTKLSMKSQWSTFHKDINQSTQSTKVSNTDATLIGFDFDASRQYYEVRVDSDFCVGKWNWNLKWLVDFKFKRLCRVGLWLRSLKTYRDWLQFKHVRISCN